VIQFEGISRNVRGSNNDYGRKKEMQMKAYEFRAMDNSGNEEKGFMGAASEDEVAAQLRDRGLFVTSIGLFDFEPTPAWSTISLASPTSIPSGPLMAEGVPCTLEQKGMTFPGLLNLLGMNGDLQLVFSKSGAMGAIFELPIRTISQVQQKGVFRKRLVITTSTLEEYVLNGSIKEANRLYNWATFAIEMVASGDS
jgi:hypothetical protein